MVSIILELFLIMCFTFLKPCCCSFLLEFLFKINFLISRYKFWGDNLSNIMQWSVVSGSPPRFEIIVAHPLEEDSRAVLPNGSSHRDGTTAIPDLFKKFRTFLCFKNPISVCLLWCMCGLFLFSSPIEKAFQSSNSSKIFKIASL